VIYLDLIRHMGWPWVANRALYEVKRRSGLLKRAMPLRQWSDYQPTDWLSPGSVTSPEAYLAYRRERAPRFLFDPGKRRAWAEILSRWDSADCETPLVEAAEVRKGRIRFFSDRYVDLGFPPEWHRLGDRVLPADVHWSEIDDFKLGDIKLVWEPSRFGFVYALVRAYWRTGDESFAETFWTLVEDWALKNAPNHGPNWKCGQETAFRVMALCFGLHGFLDAAATTGERVLGLGRLLFVSGERIAANIGHAINQKNNHGISEAVGLWTLGTLFPEFPTSAQWRETGRLLLESQVRELMYPDGGCSQHSFNYQRVMLHDCLWAARLAEAAGTPFSEEFRERIRSSAWLLYQSQDEQTGQVPNFGNNDGALVLPLNNCGYQDFRPVLQAAWYFVTGKRRYGEGCWDEDLLWLFGESALGAERESTVGRENLAAAESGYYSLRSGDGFVFTRCGAFRHRPAHADLLHMDLWWKGVNIACDAGTYSYNAPEAGNNVFAETGFHNTLTVGGRSQMDSAGRFLWLPWVRGRLHHFLNSESGRLAYLEGGHDGYERVNPPVFYRRGVLRCGDRLWIVLDGAWSRRSCEYRLNWLLPDLAHDWNPEARRLRVHTAHGDYWIQFSKRISGSTVDLVRADSDSPRGWRSTKYNSRTPGLSIVQRVTASEVLFLTIFGAEPLEASVEGTRTIVESTGGERVTMAHPENGLLSRVLFEGAETEALEIP
jgi:hypothetical protein